MKLDLATNHLVTTLGLDVHHRAALLAGAGRTKTRLDDMSPQRNQ